MKLNDLYHSKNSMGVIKSNGGEERCILCFGGKVWGKETTWKT